MAETTRPPYAQITLAISDGSPGGLEGFAPLSGRLPPSVFNDAVEDGRSHRDIAVDRAWAGRLICIYCAIDRGWVEDGPIHEGPKGIRLGPNGEAGEVSDAT